MVNENIRTATIADIPALIALRGSVGENRLSDSAKVNIEDYRRFHQMQRNLGLGRAPANSQFFSSKHL